jgi:hypothetical protein
LQENQNDVSSYSDRKSHAGYSHNRLDESRLHGGGYSQRQDNEENKSIYSECNSVKTHKGTKKVDFLNINPDTLGVVESYVEALLKIFQFYCSIGEPMNTTKMKSSKFIKLLNESGLINVKIILFIP